jgi:hypothetical protein
LPNKPIHPSTFDRQKRRKEVLERVHEKGCVHDIGRTGISVIPDELNGADLNEDLEICTECQDYFDRHRTCGEQAA